MFQSKAVEEIKTHILCSVTLFFSKIVFFLDNVEKYDKSQTDHRRRCNTAHALCILDK